VKGFKPYGFVSASRAEEPVNLLYEEYEAMRLSDYEHYNHHQASIVMGVSRPTFTRIYASALQKLATAFVEGRQIAIEGGKIFFDSDWFQCTDCSCYFNNPEKDKPVERCPLCGSHRVSGFDMEKITSYKILADGQDECICTVCGFEIVHQPGKPCNQERCPQCNSVMRRKKVLEFSHQKND
jgi:predicted DNA-binding protein (UPF0251 family)